MSGIERRLAKLEQVVASPRETVHVWADADLADAIARQFPEGVPNGVTVLAYRWADADQSTEAAGDNGNEA